MQKAIRTLKKFDGVVEQATEAELADAAARADRTGLFNCPHTGVALAALEKLVARREIRPTDRAVVVCTANGLKFTDFKVQYHEGTLPAVPKPQYANHPVYLPNDYVAVRGTRRLADGPGPGRLASPASLRSPAPRSPPLTLARSRRRPPLRADRRPPLGPKPRAARLFRRRGLPFQLRDAARAAEKARCGPRRGPSGGARSAPI